MGEKLVPRPGVCIDNNQIAIGDSTRKRMPREKSPTSKKVQNFNRGLAEKY